MTLLTRLFGYRATAQRSPTEDFLSEAFVEWLRLVGKAGLLGDLLGELLLPGAQCLPPGDDGRSIRWSSQHVIGPGFRGSGKRPDIVGQTNDFFLIIENKIGAGFTHYDDADGAATQLDLYADYQRRRNTAYGGIVLLTHHTDPPVGWTDPVVTWSSIHRWMSRRLPELRSGASGPVTVLIYWTQHLIAFLEENGMTGTRIALSDIIAMPAFERLRYGMRGLGVLAGRELIVRAGGNTWRSLRVPHGKTSGEFSETRFFGALMTPEGVKADNCDFAIWCGVLASEAYGIAPHVSGIPELSVGFGSWTQHPLDYQKCITLRSILEERLTSSAPNMEWSIEWKPMHWEPNKGMLVVQARLSLIELHRLSGDECWDDQARSFFRTACNALFALPESNWAEIEKCTTDGGDETGTAEEEGA